MDEEESINLYGFCMNSCVNLFDVHGEYIQVIIGAKIVDVIVSAGIAYLASEILTDAIEILLDDTTGQQCPQARCAPCIPPVGALGYRIDVCPPSKPHYPHKGTHTHISVVHQRPPEKGCDCFWHKLATTDDPPPAGAIQMNGQPGGGGVIYY